MKSLFHSDGELCSYAVLEKEDPHELKHRRAQFLIYKSLDAVDVGAPRTRRPCLALRLCRRVRLRAGRRLVRLRKAVGASFCVVRRRLMSLRHAFCRSPPAPLPPLFRL